MADGGVTMAKRKRTPKDADIEREIRRSLIEKIAYDVDKTMLMRCLVCGFVGFSHLETRPHICSGFVAPSGAAP